MLASLGFSITMQRFMPAYFILKPNGTYKLVLNISKLNVNVYFCSDLGVVRPVDNLLDKL